MSLNLLEQLADWEVPPPPAQFDAQLHERVNRSLVKAQVIDLVVRGLPWTLAHFARAIVGLFTFTLLGRYEVKPKDKRR